MESIDRDVARVSQLGAVPTILEVVCRTTDMGFAAVARVTEDRWVACAVRDEIAFGLQPGGELPIETTICDQIRQSGRLVVIDNVAQDARFCGHPIPEQYGFQSYISVPIVLHDGRFFGTLCALDRRPAKLDRPHTIGMFTLFAQLIAFLLAQHDQLAELESEVARRTAALNQANAQLAHQVEVTREDRESLRALTAELQRVREEERKALARELHDEFGQALTMLKIGLSEVHAGAPLDGPNAARQAVLVGEMSRTVDSMLDGVQRIVSELRPIVLDVLGFAQAAASAVAEFERRSGLPASFDDRSSVELSADAAVALFRVLQESLTNVTRHAGATSVRVLLRAEGEDVLLTVVDDGRGIAETDAKKPTAFGLRGMDERLRALDGGLTVNQLPAGGTELTARIPIARAASTSPVRNRVDRAGGPSA